jgi:hypothetical protein
MKLGAIFLPMQIAEKRHQGYVWFPYIGRRIPAGIPVREFLVFPLGHHDFSSVVCSIETYNKIGVHIFF